MKKVLFLLLVAVASVTAWAQEPILLEDGFKTSGSMNMYWETENTADISKADDGARWHLECKDGQTTFWIDMPPANLYNLSRTQWKRENAVAVMSVMQNGLKVYKVSNLTWTHLFIMEYEKNKFMVQLCTVRNSE